MISSLRFGDLPPGQDRKEAWREVASALYRCEFDPEAVVDDEISVRNYNLGEFVFGRSISPDATHERTIEQISRQSLDHLSFRLYLSGSSSIVANGRTFAADSDALQVFDLSQPMRSRTDRKEMLHLLLPRRAFESRLGDVSEQHGSLMSQRESPLVRLMTAHMRHLPAAIETADTDQRRALTVATVAIANAVLTKTDDGPYERETILGIAMRQFVEGDLPSFDLGTEKLCARFGLSRTSLYASFEWEGGVATYVRERRLARAMRMLSGLESGGPRRISAVGYACGFETDKMFSRAFKRRYDVNPSEVDASFRPQVRLEAGATLMSWINGL